MQDVSVLAKKAGIAPSKAAGQHFLADEKELSRIVKASSLAKGDHILEIGPGLGVLTRELAKAGANVAAVELDRKLAAYLKKNISNVRIVQGDILSFSNQEIAAWFGNEPYRIVANIPYNITGRIIKKFVSSDAPKPASAALLVQKEVAERVCAQPGDLSLLALSVQLYAKPKIAFTVSKKAFWPEPKVESGLLIIDDVSEIPNHPLTPSLIKEGEVIDEKRFWQIVRMGFVSPRKQLRNNLAAGLHMEQDAIKAALKRAKLKETSRAQELSIREWVMLIRALGEK
ncbi:MAG: 16S rRNA (adenine(1518)-N(6)/adenine(1519)-N(6))-dimethyltransferase RsmA [bacterium]|nr:16S rRNA (adenine(1518)-N(6)/adenine(1519)-N(6))-dimethyltransferase RsmA [bacterium]